MRVENMIDGMSDACYKLDEIAESCQPSAGVKITACADEIRDLIIGGN